MQWNIRAAAIVIAVFSGFASAPAIAAEREQVRAVANLIASVKMPYPEHFESRCSTPIPIATGPANLPSMPCARPVSAVGAMT
jgi:hypothetical protein